MRVARKLRGILLLLTASVAAAQEGLLSQETFEKITVSGDGTLASAVGRFVVEGEGALLLDEPRGWEAGARALRLPGGVVEVTVLEMAPGVGGSGTLEFSCQKDGRRQPFDFRVSLLDRDGVESVHDLTKAVNARERSRVVLPVPPGVVQARFFVKTVPGRGVWIDDVALLAPAPMTLESAVFSPSVRPLVQGESVWVGTLDLRTVGTQAPLAVGGATLTETWAAAGEEASEGPPLNAVASWTLQGRGPLAVALEADVFADASRGALAMNPIVLTAGLNRLAVHVRLEKAPASRAADGSAAGTGTASWEALWTHSARLGFSLEIASSASKSSAGTEGSIVPAHAPTGAGDSSQRFRSAVRLVAAEIDVRGLSLAAAPVVAAGAHERLETLLCAASLAGAGVTLFRSQDGGERWAPVELPAWSRQLKHASLTFDLWEHRFHLIATPPGSGLAHAFSDDLGLTWHDYRVLDGLTDKRVRAAGSTGIVMSTGALVVPVVVTGGFRIPDEDCAGIVVSQDGGGTWSVPSAAYPNTTTAAVVELGPGALMLNMTDGRGGARSERLTRDLGVKWKRRRGVPPSEIHRSAGSDGALLHLGWARSGEQDSRLVFANAANPKRPLREMTIKGSSDSGGQWPAKHRLLLDEGTGVDHPSLAPVGENSVGIVYVPGSGGAIFQRLPESEVVPPSASWFDVTGGR